MAVYFVVLILRQGLKVKTRYNGFRTAIQFPLPLHDSTFSKIKELKFIWAVYINLDQQFGILISNGSCAWKIKLKDRVCQTTLISYISLNLVPESSDPLTAYFSTHTHVNETLLKHLFYINIQTKRFLLARIAMNVEFHSK